MYDAKELTDFFHIFEWELTDGEHYCSDWPQFKSADAERLLREKVSSMGGLLSVSHFIIAFHALRDSGAITKLRQPRPPEIEFTLTAAEYQRTPASTITRRYQAEPEYRAAVDALITAGEI